MNIVIIMKQIPDGLIKALERCYNESPNIVVFDEDVSDISRIYEIASNTKADVIMVPLSHELVAELRHVYHGDILIPYGDCVIMSELEPGNVIGHEWTRISKSEEEELHVLVYDLTHANG